MIQLVQILGIAGILVWYLWYTTTVVEPRRDREAQQRLDMFRADLAEERRQRTADLAEERRQRNGLYGTLRDLVDELRHRPCLMGRECECSGEREKA